MLTGLWNKALPYLLAFVAAIGVALGLVKWLLGAGRKMERADALTSITKDVEKRHEVDVRVATERDPLERLRQDWSRD